MLEPSDRSEFCRAALSLGSIAKLTSLLGLGNGIVSVLLAFFLALLGVKKYADMSSSMAFLFCVLGPVIGLLQGALLGVFGYPLYSFLAKRRDGHTLRGTFTTLRVVPMRFGRQDIPQPSPSPYAKPGAAE